jgi:hypothetical protein
MINQDIQLYLKYLSEYRNLELLIDYTYELTKFEKKRMKLEQQKEKKVKLFR